MAEQNTEDKRGIYHNNEANNDGVIIDERTGVAVHESMVSDQSANIAAAEAAQGDDSKLGGVEATSAPADVKAETTTANKSRKA